MGAQHGGILTIIPVAIDLFVAPHKLVIDPRMLPGSDPDFQEQEHPIQCV